MYFVTITIFQIMLASLANQSATALSPVVMWDILQYIFRHTLTHTHTLSHTLTHTHNLSHTLTRSHTLTHTLTLSYTLLFWRLKPGTLDCSLLLSSPALGSGILSSSFTLSQGQQTFTGRPVVCEETPLSSHSPTRTNEASQGMQEASWSRETPLSPALHSD